MLLLVCIDYIFCITYYFNPFRISISNSGIGRNWQILYHG